MSGESKVSLRATCARFQLPTQRCLSTTAAAAAAELIYCRAARTTQALLFLSLALALAIY